MNNFGFGNHKESFLVAPSSKIQQAGNNALTKKNEAANASLHFAAWRKGIKIGHTSGHK